MKLELISSIPENKLKSTPLVFVHGSFYTAWCWAENFLPFFSKKGYACYALSLRGHGKSEGYEKLDSFSLSDYVSDVLEILSTLKEPPVLIGHSMGGAVVQKLLESHQEKVKAAALLCATPYDGTLKLEIIYRMLFKSFKEVKQLIRFDKEKKKCRTSEVQFPYKCLFSDYLPAEKRNYYLSLLQRESVRVNKDQARPIVAKPENIRVPILVMGVKEDWFVPEQEIQKMAKVYRTQEIMIPRSGHSIMLDISWETAAEGIDKFLTAHVS